MDEKPFAWGDLKLFLLVARAGGLSPAARLSHVSPPTLGRRLAALEQALGRTLFVRKASGFDLTDAGRELRAHAEGVEAAVLDIERWAATGIADRTVRVSAGSWTSRFLARHVADLWSERDRFRLAFVAADRRLDIARREADIGIRNRRPEETRLAGRRIGAVAFAPYAADPPKVGSDAGEPAWIGLKDGFETPSAQWVRLRHGARIAIEAGTPRLVLDLLQAGVGQAVLPCFVGDAEPGLRRAGPPIEALRHEQWLVMHDDDRHDPAIRTVARRIVRLVTAKGPLFSGRSSEDDG